MVSLATLFIVLALLSAIALVYPYIVYPFLLRLLPQHPIRKVASRESRRAPKSAMLFCAYNEEASLPAKIENLRMLKREVPDLQILAFSDCSSDRTNRLLAEASDILEPVFATRRTGKAPGMWELVGRTEAEILVFTDANVIVESGSLGRLLGYFTDPSVGAVAATLIYDRDGSVDATVTARVGGLYWRLEEEIKKLETRTGSMMGADGSFFARRRSGYPRIPAELLDDMAVSLGVLFDGLRCISAPDVIGYEAPIADRNEEFRRKRRIGCRAYSTYRFLRGEINCLSPVDRFKFYSHKVLRWLGAFFLLVTAIFMIVALLTAGFGIIGAVSLIFLSALFMWLGKRNVPFIGSAYEIVSAIVATGVGVVESIAGRRYETWDPAKTR